MRKTLQHKFVDDIPGKPEEGILYIAVEWKTAVHLCICGCGNKVVTPITPNDWRLTFYGNCVSLYPSIGNWSFPCRTHYFITKNEIETMGKWSDSRIKQGREYENDRKKKHYKNLDKDDSSKGLKKE